MTVTQPINITQYNNDKEFVSASDAAWILSNAFLILTMQSGFGLLEAGYVHTKNVTNIMVKNVVDVCLGGITYWSFGYGLSFGQPSNWFCGLGDFFATALDTASEGSFYTKYVFQFSFATAATTIVSGAIAERMKLTTYMVFSVLNTFVYCFPVCWAWNETGFLYKMGFHDFAGACVVHMGGGASALVAAVFIGPRIGRFDKDKAYKYGIHSPVTALTGTFMLWWAWLAFNSGSTFAVEGHNWKVAAKASVNTLNGSIGGGLTAIALCFLWRRNEKGDMIIDVNYLINGVLAGLVAITAGCAVYSPAVSLLVGSLGCLCALATASLLDRVQIDDPVGAIGVHCATGILSTILVGVFGKDDYGEFVEGRAGVLINGSLDQLCVQMFGIICIFAWSAGVTLLIFLVFHYTIGSRVSAEDEELGADWTEHDIKHGSMNAQMEKALNTAMQQNNVHDVGDFMGKFVRKLIELDVQEEPMFRHLSTSHHNWASLLLRGLPRPAVAAWGSSDGCIQVYEQNNEKTSNEKPKTTTREIPNPPKREERKHQIKYSKKF